ncbi:MAG: helix-turn-helix domain-containing protein [Alphaproteobacteria bacterium]
MNIQTGVIEAIRTKMVLYSLSQAELARRSGVTQPAISRLLRGLSRPKATTVAKLLDTLELDIEGYGG